MAFEKILNYFKTKDKKITADNIYDILDELSEQENKKETKKIQKEINYNNRLISYKSFLRTGGIVLLMFGLIVLQSGGVNKVYTNTVEYFDNFETPQTKKILLEKKMNKEFRKKSTNKYKNTNTGETIYVPILENVLVNTDKNPRVDFVYDNKKYSLFVNDTFADNIYTITDISNINIAIKRADGFEIVIPVEQNY